jgi:hypothetical protein
MGRHELFPPMIAFSFGEFNCSGPRAETFPKTICLQTLELPLCNFPVILAM